MDRRMTDPARAAVRKGWHDPQTDKRLINAIAPKR
jgi:hypothetical protein